MAKMILFPTLTNVDGI